jgi:hypothetical protein
LCITHPINAHHVLPKEASICESLVELCSSSVGTQGLSNQLFILPQNLAYQESPSCNAKQNLKMVLSNQYGRIQAKTNQ